MFVGQNKTFNEVTLGRRMSKQTILTVFYRFVDQSMTIKYCTDLLVTNIIISYQPVLAFMLSTMHCNEKLFFLNRT